MDVSATGPGVAAAAPQPNVEAITGVVASSAPAPAPQAPVADATAKAAIRQTLTTPAPVPGGQNRTLTPAIAKLFAAHGLPDPIRLNVSYRVQRDPDVIVTVFSDPKTGQEVAQFPPEILINLATFFDHHQGVTLDRNA
jgi:hypothetical protein